jgi:hypothetical protein
VNFVVYSVAMDESTDATDTVQLAIFDYGVDKNFKMMEELTALVPLKGTIMTADLYTALQNTFMMHQLKINMSALTTDGTPALLSNKGGVAVMIQKRCRRIWKQ